MAGYFTISGIQNETTVLEKDWPLFALKENCDNSWDWLNDFYATTVSMNVYNYRARRYIGIRAWIDKISGDPNETRIFHLCVRWFEQLAQIFNYAQWHRYQAIWQKYEKQQMTWGLILTDIAQSLLG